MTDRPDTPAATDTPRTEAIPMRLIEVVGTALYGWSDDEPNDATGYAAVYEATKVAAAIHRAGYREAAATPQVQPAEDRHPSPLLRPWMWLWRQYRKTWTIR